ncbi:MSHA biogenesis protein MshO, partial [Vibrio parahaemolyticus]
STLNLIPANRRMVINPSRYEDLQSTSSQNIAIGGLAKTGKVFVVTGAASMITGSSVSSRLYIYREKSEVRYCFDTKRVTRNDITVADSVDTSV